jgi:hypothetical protein
VRYPLTRLALGRRKAVGETVGFPYSLFINLNSVTIYGEAPGLAADAVSEFCAVPDWLSAQRLP